MAGDAHSGLTAAEGRRFALTVAAGFAVLGGAAALRSHGPLATVLFIVAGAFVLGALVAPSHLGPVRAAWMALGVALSRVMAPVFYAAVYWAVLTPMGILRRTFGRSPVARDARASSYWIARDASDDEGARRQMERQF